MSFQCKSPTLVLNLESRGRLWHFFLMQTTTLDAIHRDPAILDRAIAQREALEIFQAGRLAARLKPWSGGGGPTLRERRLRPGFARLAGRLGPKSAADDVTRFIAEEREGREAR
jgi:hypothetical protein